jgi:hypothetical protein
MNRVLPLLLLTYSSATNEACIGEYVRCPNNGACVLDVNQDCGACASGYLCPTLDGVEAKCIDTIADYGTCPGLKGTHLDATLSEQARLDYLTAHTKLKDQIQQLQNVRFFPARTASF